MLLRKLAVGVVQEGQVEAMPFAVDDGRGEGAAGAAEAYYP